MYSKLLLSDSERFDMFKNRKPLNLGCRQKRVLKMLLEGHHISVFKDLSNFDYDVCVSDDEKENTYEIQKNVFGSLCGHGLFEKKTAYTTVQPDTEVIEFRLRDSVKDWVSLNCS